MRKRLSYQQAYNDALMKLVLDIGYPEFPGRTEDQLAVIALARRFQKTPEQVASDFPQAAKQVYSRPTRKDYNLDLVDNFD